MKRSLALLVLGLSLAPLAIFSTSAQNGAPVPQPAEPRPVQPPPVPVPQATAQPIFGQPGMPGRNQVADVLSQNYSVKLEAKTGDGAHTASLVTADRQISFSTQQGSVENSVAVQLSGSLQEGPEKQLVLRYQIQANIPSVQGETASPAVSGAPGGAGPRPLRQVVYKSESASGAVHVTLGKTHTLFASGDRSYSVTVSAADTVESAKPGAH